VSTLTPAQRDARRNSRLDQRCRQCGTTSAATSYCCHCHSTDLEYREHLPGPKPGEPGPRPVQWCQQDNTPSTADPARRARSLAALVVPPQSETAREDIAAPDGMGTLWDGAA
jgi:hypothetical protein